MIIVIIEKKNVFEEFVVPNFSRQQMVTSDTVALWFKQTSFVFQLHAISIKESQVTYFITQVFLCHLLTLEKVSYSDVFRVGLERDQWHEMG